MLNSPKDLTRFIVALEEKSRENPQDMALMQRLARLHLKNNSIYKAIDLFKKILRNEPNNYSVMIELALCLSKYKDFDEALFLLERANEIKPGQYNLFYAMAQVYEAMNKTDEQIAFMMRAVNAAPEKYELRLSLADLLKKYGDHAGALDQYQTLVAMFPDLEAALFSLGTFLMKREKTAEAANCFKKILRKNPGAFDAHFNLANCYFRMQQYKNAIMHFRMSSRRKSLTQRAFYLTAQCHFRLRDFDHAIVAMERLVELDTSNISYNKSLGEIYESAGEYDLARDIYKKLAEIAPERSEFMIKKVKMMLLLDEHEEAQDALSRLFRVHPGHIEGHRLLGEIYISRGLYIKALEEFHRSLMINEDYGEIYACMAKVHELTDNTELEIECLQKAVKLGVVQPKVLLRLGQLETQKSMPNSIERFKKLTKIAPNSDYAREAEYYIKHYAA